jgi:hypothetical protein
MNKIKRLSEQSNEPSLKVVFKLFKLLDEEKKKNRTRASLLEVIKNFVPYLGIPKGYEQYILELYVLNFKKDGDYSNLTKDNFIDPRKQKGKTISNTKAKLYTIAQLPFRGSNLEGFWDKDFNGVPYYKVSSYEWYPIYIFKDDKWYEVTKSYSSSTGKQMNNSNPVSWDNSRVECFVRNVYYKLGLIDGDFKQTSLSKIVDENFEQYDPVPDEYFKHPISGELVISETFGFSQKHGDNDRLSKLYVEKSKVKYQLYSKYIFIDLWVKTLTLKEILNLINDKLIIGGIINNPLLFSEDLMPQSEKIHIESELKEIKKRIGIFDLTKLKEIDQYLHNKLAHYCKDLGTTSIQFLNDRIYPEIELPIGEGGFLSIKGFIRNNDYTKRVMDLISEGKVKNTKDLFREDSALYYCIYRMTHSNKKTITQWMDETFPNLNRKKKSNELTYEEVLNTVSGFKNRNEVQLKYPGIYKYAKQLGIINKIYPKQTIKNV